MKKATLVLAWLAVGGLMGGCLTIQAKAPDRIVVPGPADGGPPPPPPEGAPPPHGTPPPPVRGELLPIVGYDTLAHVREPVQLALWQPHIHPGTEVALYHKGQAIARAQFDASGWARASFVPATPGIWVVTARTLTGVRAEGLLVLSVQPRHAPLVVVDLDHAIVASRARREWLGQNKAITGAAAALAAIGQRHPIVYSTSHTDELAQATRNWLDRSGFPAGPILLDTTTADPFKSAAPGILTGQFPRTRAAVTHKTEEAEAWAARGVPTYLLLKIDEDDYKDLRKAARDVRRLPRGISPVTAWNQVQDGLLRNVQYSPHVVADQLDRQADYWEHKKKKDD